MDRPERAGFFSVDVWGNAQNHTTGIQLVRDPHFVGGLKIDVMGWTGPIGQGTTPYKAHGTFNGQFFPRIVISGRDKTEVIEVKEIPNEQADDFVKEHATTAG